MNVFLEKNSFVSQRLTEFTMFITCKVKGFINIISLTLTASVPLIPTSLMLAGELLRTQNYNQEVLGTSPPGICNTDSAAIGDHVLLSVHSVVEEDSGAKSKGGKKHREGERRASHIGSAPCSFPRPGWDPRRTPGSSQPPPMFGVTQIELLLI